MKGYNLSNDITCWRVYRRWCHSYYPLKPQHDGNVSVTNQLGTFKCHLLQVYFLCIQKALVSLKMPSLQPTQWQTSRMCNLLSMWFAVLGGCQWDPRYAAFGNYIRFASTTVRFGSCCFLASIEKNTICLLITLKKNKIKRKGKAWCGIWISTLLSIIYHLKKHTQRRFHE